MRPPLRAPRPPPTASWRPRQQPYACAVVALLLGLAWTSVPPPALAATTGSHAPRDPPPVSAASPKPADLEAVDARIKATRLWITHARSNEATTTRALREAETELGDARVQLGALNKEASALAAQQEQLVQRITTLDADRARLTMRAAAHLRVLQRLGGSDATHLLLMLESPTDTPKVMTYYGYLQRARQAVLRELAQSRTALSDAQRSLAAQRQALEEKRHAVQAEAARIAQLHTQRSAALTALQGDIGARDAELKRLRAERAELQSLLASLARPRPGATIPLPPGTLFGQAKGRLPWPVTGRVSAKFGATKENTPLKWEGLLIDAPEGSEVDAVHQGQVAFTGWMRGLGTIVILDHGNGFMSLYAHLNTVSRQAGERIAAGTPLGAVGTSGGRSEPALYFEIRQRGAPVDPAAWLGRP